MVGKSAKGKEKLFKQYAALPYTVREGELMVMLVTSRETKRWVIPKGWPEKKLKPHQVAETEAFEEAGLVGDITPEPFGSFQYYKRISEKKRKHCTVDVFPLLVREELDEWPEKEERRREWVTPAEAALRVAEAGLIEMLLTISALAADGGWSGNDTNRSMIAR